MDSYEWNKIAGWVLAATASILGLSILTGALFQVHLPEQPAFVVEGVEEAGGLIATSSQALRRAERSSAATSPETG